MKGRLLLGMLLLSLVMLIMYYKLVRVHTELLSGFITMVAVTMTNIWNNAEDILNALFKMDPTAKHPVVLADPLKPDPGTLKSEVKAPNVSQEKGSIRIILLIPLVAACLGGCIGYRISHVTGNINGTNIQTPYGPATGNLLYDATTCFGNCPKDTVNVSINNNGPESNPSK